MGSHAHHQGDKVRLTVECSFDERTYIKMLAAKKHMTISELLLNSIRKKMPSDLTKSPNPATVEALEESREGDLESYKSLEEFWGAMGIDPDA